MNDEPTELADFLALLDEASRTAREREIAYRTWLDRKLPALPADLRAAGIRIEWEAER